MIFEYIRDLGTSAIQSLNRNFELIAQKLNEGWGTKDLQDNAVTTQKIQDGSITSLKVANGEIIKAFITDLTSQTANIHDLTVQTEHVGDLDVQHIKISDGYAASLNIDWSQIANAQITNANIQDASIDFAKLKNVKIGNAEIQDASIDQAKINLATILKTITDQGIIKTAQIGDGQITNLKVAGDLDATKITVGTLSVDRLIIRGTTESLVYELNNITGALQSTNVNTLNGEILTPRTINADKIIADSITGNEIAARTITANEIATNTITSAEIKTGSIDASSIKANSLTVDTINATVLDKLNNFTKSGTLDGWVASNPTLGTQTIETNALKGNTKVVNLTNTANQMLSTDYIEVDPTKNYKLNLSVYTTATTGIRYFGFYAYAAKDGAIVQTTPFTISNRTFQTDGSNPYFWSQNGATPGGWVDLEGYLMGVQATDADFPQGKNVTSHFRFKPNVRYIKFRFLNYSNGTDNNTALFWNPSITEIGSGQINAGQINAGTLTVGGQTSGVGAIKVLNANGEETGRWDASTGSFSTMSIGTLQAQNVVLRNNISPISNIYVDATAGSDSNDGTTWAKAFKSFDKALNSIPKWLDNGVTVNIKGTFTDRLSVYGFAGGGSLVLSFDATTVINGALQFTSCTNQIFVYGNGCTINHNPAINSAIVVAFACNFVSIDNMNLQGKSGATAHGFLGWRGSKIYATNINVNNVTQYGGGIDVYDCSQGYASNCKGSGNWNGIQAAGGSYIGINGTCPMGTSAHTFAGTGSTIGGTATATAGTGSNTGVTYVTKTYNSTWTSSYRTADGWRAGLWQGTYGGTAALGYKGVIGFDLTTLRSDLSGKMIDSAKLTLARQSTGGSGAAVPIFLWDTNSTSGSGGEPPAWHTKTNIGSLARGQQATFSIPTSFVSNLVGVAANSFLLYDDTLNTSYYALLEGVGGIAPVLEVTYH